ncbi:MAG: phosphate ABC transporter ATP-binding protein [Bacteroidetes bacterium]|nr:MAG: phosphate ABC transporter ATP-binding protein [Bacteroidota bacterium]
MSNTIEIENLNVFYGERHALKNITITIPEKKITAIIGPSGCGKTTLLKCFNRLIDTNEGVKVTGKLNVDGENIFGENVEITHIRKKMGLVSQRPFPLPMSIFDNIAFGPRIHGETNKEKLAEIVEKQLKDVSLWDEVKDRLKSPASRLSIGQQQRLCLARGLAVEPQLILGDEPTSALDPVSSKHIEEKFLQLKNDYTLVVVTHSLPQARRIADYIIFMYAGEIVEHGTASEILDFPKLERTKEYVFGKIS